MPPYLQFCIIGVVGYIHKRSTICRQAGRQAGTGKCNKMHCIYRRSTERRQTRTLKSFCFSLFDVFQSIFKTASATTAYLHADKFTTTLGLRLLSFFFAPVPSILMFPTRSYVSALFGSIIKPSTMNNNEKTPVKVVGGLLAEQRSRSKIKQTKLKTRRFSFFGKVLSFCL